MLKKIAFAAILAIQFAAVASIATADAPWPLCYPCLTDGSVATNGR